MKYRVKTTKRFEKIMFRQKPRQIDDCLKLILRQQGLEQPLLERRLMAAWSGVCRGVAGERVAEDTAPVSVTNGTLVVKTAKPVLRSELAALAPPLVNRLNAAVQQAVITRLRFV